MRHRSQLLLILQPAPNSHGLRRSLQGLFLTNFLRLLIILDVLNQALKVIFLPVQLLDSSFSELTLSAVLELLDAMVDKGQLLVLVAHDLL
jgi:hypothetical protein